MNIPDSNISVSTVVREIECHNTLTFSIKVQFYCAGKKLPVVLMESLPAARVYANAVLQMSAATVAEIGPEDGPSEIMEREPHLSRYFPLADIASMPRVPHTPSDRLARHFDSIAVQEGAVWWGLVSLMRSGGSVAKAVRFRIDFLEHVNRPKYS